MNTTPTTPTLTAETFSALQVVFGVGMILQNMDVMKNTRTYSTKVVQACDNLVKSLEVYDRTMLKNSIWKGSGDAMDEGYVGAQLVSRMAYAALSVYHGQPEHVQERFERDLETLFIRYGVNMMEMEKL